MVTENYSKNRIQIGSEKSFGVVFSIVCFILFIFFFDTKYNFIFLSLSLMFIAVSFTIPKLLKYPNLIWFYFGIFLGKIFIPIFSFTTYFIIFFPMSLLIKIFKRNYLGIKISKSKKTYWENRTRKLNSFKDQF